MTETRKHMYKTKLTDDEQLQLCNEIKAISVKVCGTEQQRKNNEKFTPRLLPEEGMKKIAEAYCDAYWLSTLNTDGIGEGREELEEVTQYVQCMVMESIRDNILVKKRMKTDDGDKEYWGCPLKDKMKLPNRILESTFQLKSSKVRDAYIGKIDEAEFDKTLTHLLKDLYKVEDFDTAFKFFKLWLINTKMKRFFTRSGEGRRNPKTPIWLSLWSELHSIGKGFVVESMRETFEELFNANTKTLQFKDFNKQFKGFVGNGNYICHCDEMDRLEKGTSDPNTIKTMISEKRLNAERKGVDNTSDHDNNLSFISTTNQRVDYMIIKDMEEDRRLAEIHIVGACDLFVQNGMSEEDINKLTTKLWITCPVEPNGLDKEVRDILLSTTRDMARQDFFERLRKLMQAMGWGGINEDGVFVPTTKGKMRVAWTTEVRDAYGKIFQNIGGWGNFTNYALNLGFVYRTSGGKWNVNFGMVKEGLENTNEDSENE